MTLREFSRALLTLGYSLHVDYLPSLKRLRDLADAIHKGVAQETVLQGATPETVKLWKLWSAVSDWTIERWEAAAESAIKSIEYDTWSVAEFLRVEKGPRVYGWKWAEQQQQEGRAEEIAGYHMEGRERPVWGWKHECDGVLTRFTPPERRPGLPPPREPISNATRDLIARAKDQLRGGAIADDRKPLPPANPDQWLNDHTTNKEAEWHLSHDSSPGSSPEDGINRSESDITTNAAGG